MGGAAVSVFSFSPAERLQSRLRFSQMDRVAFGWDQLWARVPERGLRMVPGKVWAPCLVLFRKESTFESLSRFETHPNGL